MSQSSPAIAESREALALSRRYKDAYTVANTTISFGTLIKICAVLLAGMIFVGSIALAGNQAIFAGLGVFLAVSTGSVLFILGLIISAQGQVLLASLDGAVNSSPFLADAQRAEIMRLNHSVVYPIPPQSPGQPPNRAGKSVGGSPLDSYYG